MLVIQHTENRTSQYANNERFRKKRGKASPYKTKCFIVNIIPRRIGFPLSLSHHGCCQQKTRQEKKEFHTYTSVWENETTIQVHAMKIHNHKSHYKSPNLNLSISTHT